MNKVIIMGRLGKDPEVRSVGGSKVASFSVATDESYKDREGEKVERTEWHRIVCWGRTAEICGEYLRKGDQALIEGKLQTREYEDRSGVKRKVTEVIADRVTFVGSRRDRDDGPGEARERPAKPANRSAAPSVPPEDEIPF